MKTCALLFAGAMLAAIPQTSQAKEFNPQELPNGSNFDKSLLHKQDGSHTAFASMFSSTWSAALCKDTFPGSTFSVGQAFGDPCCTWTKGGKPDFDVKFTADFPAQSTKTCAAGGARRLRSSANTAGTPAVGQPGGVHANSGNQPHGGQGAQGGGAQGGHTHVDASEHHHHHTHDHGHEGSHNHQAGQSGHK